MFEINLNSDDRKLYAKIAKHGDIDDMFALGYQIGRETFAREQLEKIEQMEDLVDSMKY